MRKLKYIVGILLLFMVIGFATVTVTLGIAGNVNVISDVSDFKVYFSDVRINGVRDMTVVNSDKELVFAIDLAGLGATHVIEYDITNASSVFDASLSVNCTQGDDLLSITNIFDFSTNLLAKETRSGSLILKKLKVNTNETDTNYSVTCSIDAVAVGRDVEAEAGGIIGPLQSLNLNVGDGVNIAGENFNIINISRDSVSMLAQYNLGTNYRQSSIANKVAFSDRYLWYSLSGTFDIDIQTMSTNPKLYVNEYVKFLRDELNFSQVSGDLISFDQLVDLGCNSSGCNDSIYSEWLHNGQGWWTKTVKNNNKELIVNVHGYSWISNANYSLAPAGIRPVITIPISLARKYIFEKYDVGKVVYVGNQKFNVVKDNGVNVKLLAQKSLGHNIYTNYYEQSDNPVLNLFGAARTWPTPSDPVDLDLRSYGDLQINSLDSYLSYLKLLADDSDISYDFITLLMLKDLGCTINDDYSYSANLTCANSRYSDWLINNHSWWTRSAVTSMSNALWYVGGDGTLSTNGYDEMTLSTRPIIIVSKKVLRRMESLISFKYGNATYYALDGMTWRDWVSSAYNNIGFNACNTNNVCSSDNLLVTTSSYDDLILDDVILKDGVYFKNGYAGQ